MLSKTRITILALTGAIAMTGAAEAAPKVLADLDALEVRDWV